MAPKRRLNKAAIHSSTKKKTMKQVEHIDQEEGSSDCIGDQEGSQHPSYVTGYAIIKNAENPIPAAYEDDDISDDSMLANPQHCLISHVEVVGTSPANENDVADSNQPLETTTAWRNGSHRPEIQTKQFQRTEQTNDSDIEIENDQPPSVTTNLEENLYDEEHTTPEREPVIKDPFAFDFANIKVTEILRPPKLILD
ncbi:unnamed protein product [Rotaria magnacalcarata]|uniref:Uncharacterized protein n=1 Tax=Rotaria magnacalcarata TaxID=392030 RepID=A0A820D130_9BILA|nr:unnamed protein product [Rotaria magnacalcarata]CAF2153149.1 unnamed protein product [Rotaria magnacalcarata]CAF4224189.1 unnamed protein product [Rotaria magnacalcarata]CAF4361159.1 unnamed protein product [Rotaria magnacalcarata]